MRMAYLTSDMMLGLDETDAVQGGDHARHQREQQAEDLIQRLLERVWSQAAQSRRTETSNRYVGYT